MDVMTDEHLLVANRLMKQMPCPLCETEGTVTLVFKYAAAPLGSHVLGESQLKVSARRYLSSTCSVEGCSLKDVPCNATVPDGPLEVPDA